MASVEFITKRLDGAQKNLATLEKKLARIRKVEAQNWEDPNPYFYSESDLKWCLKDIEEAKKNVEKYTADLAEATEKANSRNCQPILDFLAWREQRLTEWYMKAMVEAREMYAKLHEMYDHNSYKQTEEYEALHNEYYTNIHGEYKYERRPVYNYKREIMYYRDDKVKVFDGKWEYAGRYLSGSLDEAKALLAKDLKQESDAMYDDLIARVTKITGEITDASELTTNPKCGIDGFVVGKKARAEVHTIFAGGYAVQCLHCRTLVHAVK